MSNAVSHSSFEMVLPLEHLQVTAPGMQCGLLAGQNVGLTVVLCPPGLGRTCADARPARTPVLDRWRVVPFCVKIKLHKILHLLCKLEA